MMSSVLIFEGFSNSRKVIEELGASMLESGGGMEGKTGILFSSIKRRRWSYDVREVWF